MMPWQKIWDAEQISNQKATSMEKIIDKEKKSMKKLIAAGLACMCTLPMIPLSVSAAETTTKQDFDVSALSDNVYYAQNFDGLAEGAIEADALGWDAINSTATLEIKKGKNGNELIIRETAEEAHKSYFVFMPNASNVDSAKYTANSDVVTAKSYYVEFDMRFVETSVENAMSLVLNYNRETSTYAQLWLKCGTSASAFNFSKNSDLDFVTTKYDVATRFTYPGGGMEERPPLKYNSEVLADILKAAPSETLLQDNMITVRVEVDLEEKVARVFVNDIYVTATNPDYKPDNERWQKFLSPEGTEIAFRVNRDAKDSTSPVVAIDNVKVGSLDYPKVVFSDIGKTMATNRQGKLAELPAAPKAEGDFLGWYTADGVKVTENTTFYTDMTLTAKWGGESAITQAPVTTKSPEGTTTAAPAQTPATADGAVPAAVCAAAMLAMLTAAKKRKQN